MNLPMHFKRESRSGTGKMRYAPHILQKECTPKDYFFICDFGEEKGLPLTQLSRDSVWGYKLLGHVNDAGC